MNRASPTEEEIENTQWARAPDYASALHLNRAYLRGEMKSNPLFFGPINTETVSLVPKLLRLHDYGILTTQGQPPMHGIFPPFSTTREGHKPWHERKQRAWLQFLVPRVGGTHIPKTSIDNFIQSLLDHPQLATKILDECPIHGTEARLSRTMPDTGLAITEVREASSKARLQDQEFKVTWRISDWRDRSQLLLPHAKWPAVAQTVPLEIDVAVLSWDEELGGGVDLETLIEQLAIASGMIPRYQLVDWG